MTSQLDLHSIRFWRDDFKKENISNVSQADLLWQKYCLFKRFMILYEDGGFFYVYFEMMGQ